jgi:hypothetical protein
VSRALKWGLLGLGWRSHLINEHEIHPVGVYRAECGHLLMMVPSYTIGRMRRSVNSVWTDRFPRATSMTWKNAREA